MARRAKDGMAITGERTASREVSRPAPRRDGLSEMSPGDVDTDPSRRPSGQQTTDYEDEARRQPTLLIRRTLRSGQRVRFGGNVVVLGDVNPGAEISARGDIVVMGWLRGVAHAGADGDEQAVVCAFRINPTQLRIAQFIGRAPDLTESALPDTPEVAEIRDGRLVIDRWQSSGQNHPGR
ncbi:MAG: septum site-determining protein MinC [Thermaerobacter sp.]|nr:septum site-determining protein MinC [Thermaerobacter sp.]